MPVEVGRGRKVHSKAFAQAGLLAVKCHAITPIGQVRDWRCLYHIANRTHAIAGLPGIIQSDWTEAQGRDWFVYTGPPPESDL